LVILPCFYGSFLLSTPTVVPLPHLLPLSVFLSAFLVPFFLAGLDQLFSATTPFFAPPVVFC